MFTNTQLSVENGVFGFLNSFNKFLKHMELANK